MKADRGQTTQDYLVGVSVLLLTVTFVFGYTPTVFDSYENPVDGVDRTQADRAAEYLVSNYSVENQSNVLRFDADIDSLPGNSSDAVDRGIHEMLANETSRNGFLAFRNEAGLNTLTERRARPNVNVILVNTSQIRNSSDPSPIRVTQGGTTVEFSYGDDPDQDTEYASETRVVTLDNETKANFCRPTCWLVVRVW
jgi:hypothetical protein